MSNDLNRHSLKAEIQLPNKNLKKCSIMLAIREMQIQTVRRCYLTQVRVAITPQQKQKPVSMW